MSDSAYEKLNQRLVQKLYHDKRFTDEKIGRAFLNTPRHLFLPDKPLELIYQDKVVPTKFEGNRPISSSSQPAIMAIMLQQLNIESGMNVLEIGAGTGFNAALMSDLVGASGRVTTIDIDQDTVENAQTHLEAAGVTNVTVIHADGMNGYVPHAPYDRIILTVSAADIAPAWVDQLKENGRLLLPLSLNGPQKSIAFRKEKHSGRLHTLTIENCGFMPLRGTMADQAEHIFTLAESEEGELSLATRSNEKIDLTKIHTWITEPDKIEKVPIGVTRSEGWGSLNLWLALHSPYSSMLYTSGDWYHNPKTPASYHFTQGHKPYGLAPGLIKPSGIALISRPYEAADRPVSIKIHAAGEQTVLTELIGHIDQWHAAGRPQTHQLQITAYPRHFTSQPPHGALIINNQFTQLHVQW